MRNERIWFSKHHQAGYFADKEIGRSWESDGKQKTSVNTTVLPDRNMFIPTQRCLLKSLNKSIIKYPNISAWVRSEVLQNMYNKLRAIQTGDEADVHGWMRDIAWHGHRLATCGRPWHRWRESSSPQKRSSTEYFLCDQLQIKRS